MLAISRPLPSEDALQPSELRFTLAMSELGYGRFEGLQIQNGELLLDPWPTTIRSVKFGGATPNRHEEAAVGFQPKRQIVELFALVRGIEVGTIRVLEVRGGLPFCIEFEEQPSALRF